MIGRPWRLPAIAALLLSGGLVLVPQPSATLGADGACPGTTGVTVVVDFQALGGGVVTRCAPGSPASGFKALTAAGFTIGEVQNVPGFLCRIDGKPTVSQDRCVNTPPASAYWSYWHASRGGTWITSQEGGKTRKPPVGSVDGWSFSDDGSPGATPPPGITPPAPAATPRPPTATPRPATPRPATPNPTASKTPASDASTATPPPASSVIVTPPGSASTEPTTDSTSANPDAAATPPSSEAAVSSVADPGAAAVSGPDDGAASAGSPPLGTLLGIGLVIVIGGAALVATGRRSRGAGADD